MCQDHRILLHVQRAHRVLKFLNLNDGLIHFRFTFFLVREKYITPQLSSSFICSQLFRSLNSVHHIFFSSSISCPIFLKNSLFCPVQCITSCFLFAVGRIIDSLGKVPSSDCEAAYLLHEELWWDNSKEISGIIQRVHSILWFLNLSREQVHCGLTFLKFLSGKIFHSQSLSWFSFSTTNLFQFFHFLIYLIRMVELHTMRMNVSVQFAESHVCTFCLYFLPFNLRSCFGQYLIPLFFKK